MVYVQLDDSDMVIPVFATDLVRLESSHRTPHTKAKIVPGSNPKIQPPPERPPAEQQYMIIKNLGIQLAFVPETDPKDHQEKYLVYLINGTDYSVLYNIELYFGDEMEFEDNGKINPMETLFLDELLKDELNDGPVYEMDCWQLTTEGKGQQQHKTIKIKAQQFFNNIKMAPLLNTNAHIYKVFESFEQEHKPKEEDLKSYTARNTVPHAHFSPSLSKKYDIDLKAAAEFIPEIDLHIESLPTGKRKIPKNQILNVQLKYFDEFMLKAIRVKATEVFIIHGIGEGKLKDAVTARLIQMPEVNTFSNEYHHRYGFGATKVILQH